MLKQMKRTAIVAVAILLLAFISSTPVLAAPIGFAIANDSNLYSIDLGNGNATLIGAMGVFMEGIAIDNSGNLFATDTSGQLYGLNSTTGQSTLLGSSGLGNLEGLDFNGGSLITSNFVSTPTLYSLNTANGAATALVTADVSTGVVRSMTTLNSNTMLIRTDVGDTLRTISLVDGTTSIVGSNLPEIFGMDFASDGNLYGLSNNGLVYQINPNNGQTTLTGDSGNQFWLGLAAVQAVPEPSSLLLLGSGLLGLAGWRWRRELISKAS